MWTHTNRTLGALTDGLLVGGGLVGAPGSGTGREPQADVDQRDEGGDLDERADDTSEACPEVTPKVAIATAIASSKLLPAAVKASVVVRSVRHAEGATQQK